MRHSSVLDWQELLNIQELCHLMVKPLVAEMDRGGSIFIV